METWKHCCRCGAVLMGSEELGETCNECLYRHAKRTLAGYKRAERRVAKRKPTKRFKRVER